MSAQALPFVPNQAIQNVIAAYNSGVYMKPTPQSSGNQPQKTASQPSLTPMDVISQALLQNQLPKRELLEFDGNSKKYQSFITNFTTNIASK